jgi:diguanylate cyclase (GGDEF)-like protein
MALSVAIGLVILGACILAAALVTAGRSIAIKPSGRPRYAWVAVTVFMFLLIVGYMGYASIRLDDNARVSDLEVPLVFFGACLVLAVSALALTSAQYVRRLAVLESENITDSLLGIPNYRYFTARLIEEVARSNRYKPPLSLILVDVDHFTKINDTYGYRVSDLVLIALAKLVLSIARDTDITARYGHEQIAVIAPNTAAAEAGRFAERIRQAVETASLLPPEVSFGSKAAGVTVSIGVSSLGPHVRGDRALIAGAYAALLNAKHGGRNRIAVS